MTPTSPLVQLPPNLLTALGLSTFVAFDVETTGLDPAHEQIIEVGAVRFQSGVEVESFSELIHCKKPLPPLIRKMTGITDELLVEAPSPKKVLSELLDFIGDDVLVGQNISFDLGFLKADLQRCKLSKDFTEPLCVDTALLARVLLSTLPARGLSSLSRYFNLPPEASHRALPDARQSGLVLQSLLSYFSRVDLKTVDLLRRLAQGMDHPSAWIFSAWADYLMKTPALEAHFQAYQLPFLRDNFLGRSPRGQSFSESRNQGDETPNFKEINPQGIENFFQSQGELAQYLHGYEPRQEQLEMASVCTQTFNTGGILAVEAGTGVGKSLAYLAPAIAWSQANQAAAERVIVSTNTINLQEQLFYKDLPLLAESDSDSFCAVLLKGRNNYLCRSRWERLTSEQPLRLSTSERLAALSLALWATQTLTGDVSEVATFHGEGSTSLWNQIASESGSCRGGKCQLRGICFHARVRQVAAKAHVVVINHALLLSDLAADHVPIGAYRTLVVDEAHHLEKAAAQHLGIELNFWRFRFLCRRLYEAEGPPTGVLARMLLGLGTVLDKHPATPGLTKVLEEASTQIVQLRRTALDFFTKLTAKLRSQVAGGEKDYTPKLRLRDPAKFLQEELLGQIPLLDNLQKTEKSLRQIITALSEIPLTALPRGSEWADDLNGALEELQQSKQAFTFFVSPADTNWVYWAELPRTSEKSSVHDFNVLLYAAPLNTDEILRLKLFDPLRSVILTSATLTVANRFHYITRKIGLSEAQNLTTLKLGSPFDFSRQMRIVLPAFLPTPRHADFETELTQLLLGVLRQVPHSTLGLFTSYRALRAVGETLEKELPGRPLLIQGQNGSRDHLLRSFRETPGAILLGTDSFWEGIDVVGEALELLIVAKLPFEVPSEPLVEAKLEKLKNEGKDPFMYYTVPEAVIRLRQGIGRLIRSKTDRGAALICDSRLLHNRYGQAFLDSLPVPVRVFQDQDDLLKELESFFGKI